MQTLREAAGKFLAHRRIAVAGVSRDPNQPANLIYRRLRSAGYEVYAVNPYATEVEGVRCYPSIAVIPRGCPNMFGATADAGHRCMCAVLKLRGKIPRRVEPLPEKATA